jgi:hypothetical protein
MLQSKVGSNIAKAVFPELTKTHKGREQHDISQICTIGIIEKKSKTALQKAKIKKQKDQSFCGSCGQQSIKIYYTYMEKGGTF